MLKSFSYANVFNFEHSINTFSVNRNKLRVFKVGIVVEYIQLFYP